MNVGQNMLPKVAYGDGCYVVDSAGNRYLDGSGGPAVFSLGHSHPEVNTAIKTQLDRIAHGYRYTFSSDPLERLNSLIQSQVGDDLEHVLYVSSGSEAMESALKVALQYHWTKGNRSKTRFISRDRSYHGNTLGALAVSGFSQRRKQFESSLFGCSFISAANDYRPPEGISAAELSGFLAGELEQEIVRVGPENVAAFIFEPVVGATGGVVPAPAGYLREIRDVCDRYEVLMIADEVMCGSGRCGTWRALQHDDITPDIMAIGKSLGGGYVPLGATLFSAGIGAPIYAEDGAPNTGHTFTGHTLACAAAAAVQEIMIRDKLVARVHSRGPIFMDNLRGKIEDLEAVGDIRGMGYFVGIEVVQDKSTKQPFDPELQMHERIKARTLECGLICYPIGGNIDGIHGDVAILAPPYIATDQELNEIIEKFDKGLRLALTDVGTKM